MIRYEYRCTGCGAVVEAGQHDIVWWPHVDEDPDVECGFFRRVYTAPGIVAPKNGWGH